ncbi:hypothetical protein [Inhella gelatinilytica]|uniref:Ig-like protein group 1 n=1 Tax=Inhella gelatinilytica TaxID=2795030 RepID=A0A931IUZ3_9BURK|nr:hypothetical protein [Inhella gelatinilytica]MBH9552432.1 hypothetical protein [Inhella gelatinilytica]
MFGFVSAMSQAWNRAVASILLLSGLLLLSACGGGGGAPGAPVNGGGGGTTPGTDALSVSLVLTSSSVSQANPATATATVTTAAGAPASGVLVSFAVGEGVGKVSAPSGLTDASGRTTVVLAPLTTTSVGADFLTATIKQGDKTYTAKIGYQVNASAPAVVQVTLGSSTLTPGAQVDVIATLKSSAGAPITNTVVNFTSTLKAVQLSAPSALTNSLGQAVVKATVPAGTSGAGSIGAAALVQGADVSASANFQTGSATVGTLSLALPEELGSGQSINATATLVDAAGAPIKGAVINFRALNGIATTDRPSDVTTAAGVAQAAVVKAAPTAVGAEVVEVRATVAGVELVASRTLRVTTSTTSAARIVIQMPTNPVTATQPGEAIVTVFKANDLRAANTVVNLSTKYDIGKASRMTDLTNGQGQVTVQLQAKSSTASGADELVVTSEVDGVTVTGSAPFRVNSIAAGTLNLELLDINGNKTTTVTSGSPATARAVLRTDGGAPVPGVVVSFSTLLGYGSFSAMTALTDANGAAAVQLRPATTSTSGADTVVARATLNGTALAANAGFQLTATNVAIGSVLVNPALPAQVAAYGQAEVTVNLTGTVPAEPVVVSATSSCIGEGKATLLPATVSTTTGVARFTYRDAGCGAVRTTDSLQISVAGTAANATATIGLTSPAVSAINFTSATPATIYLKGSGYTENSTVRFQVKDANGNGLPARCAQFELVSFAGGLLMEDGTAPVRRKSDANGDFFLRINSGTVPTPVRVRATLVNDANDQCGGGTVSNISTVSSGLSIAVGLPSQLNFSLSQQAINIEGYDRDGTSNTYTIIASDRLANPVPQDTAINFVAEGGGQIQPTGFIKVGGDGLARATVNYVSSEPRPRDGRITILAYALGEKSFLDLNGNNQFDTGEPFQDLGDVFIDRLFNVVYTSGNQISAGFNSTEDQLISLQLPNVDYKSCEAPGSSLLWLSTSIPSLNTGSRCTASMRAYVRRATQTILSTSAANPVWGTRLPQGSYVDAGSSCPVPITRLTGYDGNEVPSTTTIFPTGTTKLYGQGVAGGLSFLAADANAIAFNPMAAGTTVTASGTEGLTVAVVGGSPVPSTGSPSGVYLSYKFDLSKADEGVATVTLRSPITGTGTTFSQFISTRAVPTGMISCP